jgi:hypothetical protein
MPPERFVPDRPTLRVEPILRFQRYRDLGQVSPVIRDIAADMVRVAEELAAPEVAFVTRAVDRVTADSATLLDGPTFSGRCFGAHLPHATDAVCFVLTLGPAIDERIAEMAAGDELLEALFLETAGWLAVEDAVRKLRGHLNARLRPKGLRLTPRLGPGYVDWPLTEQPKLFSVFDGAPLPVALSEYCVMIPKKSISGLFGLIPAA